MNNSVFTQTPRKDRGRPREFDTDRALESAMQLFRQKGFHAASITDLSAAMMLTSGSIYKAFTDKRTLFLRAFERYTSCRNTELRRRLESLADGRERLMALLRFYIDSAHDVEGRRGCLVVGSVVALTGLDKELAELVEQAVMRNKRLIVTLVEEGQQDGSFSQRLNAEAAAQLILCLVFGMRVVGKIENIIDPEDTLRLAMKLLD
ncbi:TetR/AcrR family transcriptional regulator [Erwinia oleae]|uniref:TetR/AcrR family transcriptional regulator n=1 Tax=Erwinia oleae TaxID=796334 RepID=UPI0005506D93|nr:TetR/AcrR family transcriptional regulator [Erwinia oleae]